MSNLYLVQLPTGYALGAAEGRKRPPPTAASFELYTLEGTPLRARKCPVRIVDRVGSFRDDDELFDMFDELTASR